MNSELANCNVGQKTETERQPLQASEEDDVRGRDKRPDRRAPTNTTHQTDDRRRAADHRYRNFSWTGDRLHVRNGCPALIGSSQHSTKSRRFVPRVPPDLIPASS